MEEPKTFLVFYTETKRTVTFRGVRPSLGPIVFLIMSPLPLTYCRQLSFCPTKIGFLGEILISPENFLYTVIEEAFLMSIVNGGYLSKFGLFFFFFFLMGGSS